MPERRRLKRPIALFCKGSPRLYRTMLGYIIIPIVGRTVQRGKKFHEIRTVQDRAKAGVTEKRMEMTPTFYNVWWLCVEQYATLARPLVRCKQERHRLDHQR